MKSINVSDEDYELLMGLSKELQLQENDYQAFPYFWVPRSTKSGIGTEDDIPLLYDHDDAETVTPEEYASVNSKMFNEFLENEGYESDTEYHDIDEYGWCLFACGGNSDLQIVYSREEYISEPNFSIFKADVKGHIEGNRHHLGKDPHTYARTFFRMRRMESLVKALYRLNPQAHDDINEEARRYVKLVG